MGMIAYRNLQQTLILYFLVMTLLLTPVMLSNKDGGGIETPIGFAATTLGNKGYSSSQCQSFPI
jgi:hypothetical protein